MPTRQVTVPWQPNYNFGVGADLTLGSSMRLVVTGTPKGVAEARGATVNLSTESDLRPAPVFTA